MDKELKRILQLSGIIAEDNSVLTYDQFKQKLISSVKQYENPYTSGAKGTNVHETTHGYPVLTFDSNDNDVYGKMEDPDLPLLSLALYVDISDESTRNRRILDYTLVTSKDYNEVDIDHVGYFEEGATEDFYTKLDQIINNEYREYTNFKGGLKEDEVIKFDHVDQSGGVVSNFIDVVINDGNNITVMVKSGGFFTDEETVTILDSSTNVDQIEDAIRSRVEPIVRVASPNGKKLTDFIFDNKDVKNPTLKVLKDYTFSMYGKSVLNKVNQ